MSDSLLFGHRDNQGMLSAVSEVVFVDLDYLEKHSAPSYGTLEFPICVGPDSLRPFFAFPTLRLTPVLFGCSFSEVLWIFPFFAFCASDFHG